MTTLASAKTETLFNRLVDHHARKQGAKKLHNSRSKPQTTAQTIYKSNAVKNTEDKSLKEILAGIDKALSPNLKFESPPLQFQANRISPPSMNLDSYRGENGESGSPSIDHDTQVTYKTIPNKSNGTTNISNINRVRRDYERLHHENIALKKRVAMLEEDKQYLIDLVGSLRLEEKKRNGSNKTKKVDEKNISGNHRDSLAMAVDVALPLYTKSIPEVNSGSGEEKETLRRKSSLLKERDHLLGELGQKIDKEILTDQVIVEEKEKNKHPSGLYVNTTNQKDEVELGEKMHETQLRKIAAAPVATSGKKKFSVDRVRERRTTFGAAAQEAGLFG